MMHKTVVHIHVKEVKAKHKGPQTKLLWQSYRHFEGIMRQFSVDDSDWEVNKPEAKMRLTWTLRIGLGDTSHQVSWLLPPMLLPISPSLIKCDVIAFLRPGFHPYQPFTPSRQYFAQKSSYMSSPWHSTRFRGWQVLLPLTYCFDYLWQSCLSIIFITLQTIFSSSVHLHQTNGLHIGHSPNQNSIW